MVTLKARKITLEEVHRLLGFVPRFDGSFAPYITLNPLTEPEYQELLQIRSEFRQLLMSGKVSEGQVKLLSVAPLLRLAGYNRAPIELKAEEDISRIYVEDEDTYITGRLDILAVNRQLSGIVQTPLWILVIESKNVEASEFVGVAQMLTYAHTSLEQQNRVWGLVTNGATYQFFYIQRDEILTYEMMPTLSLLEHDGRRPTVGHRATQLLQVLKAIRDWQP
jgi:hypothetical protein